ncbi:MAG: SDR family oxidoreductase [Phaeodactylibacter sp.]|uniref:SDR family oxidoreductase n=1 Tax=Phaeodactylibacter sp. TaxID=1940289 RepID=UPI0032EB9744
MVVALTGATGLLGSNILFELFSQYRHSPGQLTVWVLGRPADRQPLAERLSELMQTDGRHYLQIADPAPFLDRIRAVDCFLGHPNLGIADDSFREMKQHPPDLFIHCAAAVDFRDQPGVVEQLRQINVEGTQQVLALSEALGVPDFAIVSTAYVCGIRSGEVAPDFSAPNPTFRNPYERSKLEAEQLVKQAGAEGRFKRVHCFRPTTICGRLIEPPIGYTPKFDVFYAWLAFFLRLKIKQLGRLDYETPAFIDIRVALRRGSGLNIIPADYAAKALVHICLQRPPSQAYHLASPGLTDNYDDLPGLLAFIKVSLPDFVEKMPADLTPLERVYYHRSVGKIYDPYISKPVPLFSLDSLHEQLPVDFPECPLVKGPALHALLEFAKQHDFGL